MKHEQILMAGLVAAVFGAAVVVSAGDNPAAPKPAPAAGATQTSTADQKEVKFFWALGAFTGSNREFKPITEDTALRTGDEIKMAVCPKSGCFVYVIHQDPQDGWQLLFPYELAQFTADYDPNTTYYVPKGPPWLKLDANTGPERIHLLAAKVRLERLELLLTQYGKAQDSAKPQTGAEILKEIRDLRNQYREFQSVALRPVRLGGTVRGDDKLTGEKPDVATVALEVVGTEFYGRTFTIDHK